MVSDISSLLQTGWENLWKNRVLWLFASLVLIEPLLRLFVPIQKDASLSLALLNLVINFSGIYFTFLSLAGVSFVAYCIVNGNIVGWDTAFQSAQKLLWRIIGLSFVLLIFIIPFGCIFALLFWQFLQTKNISYSLIFASIPLSIFAAMFSFPVTETIKNNSKIGKSLKVAWELFTNHFVKLAVMGLLLRIGSLVIIVLIGMAFILVENNFAITALGTLDFINPQLTFPNNSFFKLLIAVPQAIWQTFTISIFTLANLKYSSAKMSRHKTP